MVPNINPRGTSFKGVTAYLMHDKKAQTAERVAWSETRNLHTNDIENASKVMAYTDINSEGLKRAFDGSGAGTKREAGAVYHFSLSEDPKNQPTQEQWAGYVEQNIKKLGLEEHQYYMVAHNDEEHAHVHVVVNLIHPATGKVNSLHNDYKKLDRLAHEYELKNGIVCEDRAQKYEAWKQEKKAFKEKENREDYTKKVTNAFKQSDNSKAFKNALEHEGLTLSQGKRRSFVLVDRQGEIFALNRLIKLDDKLQRKEKNQQINAKLKGIDKKSLLLADKLQEQRQTIDRDAAEIKQQKALADAAEKVAEKKAIVQEKQDKEQAEKQQQKAALEAKIKRYTEEKTAFEQREKYRKIQKHIDGKIQKSRERWTIDELINQRDQAAQSLKANSGFIARLTGKKRAASDKLEAQEKTLSNRLESFEAETIHYTKNRPQWVIDKELKKQGIEPKKIHSETQGNTEQTQQNKAQKEQEKLRQKQQQENQIQKAKDQFNQLSESQKRVVSASEQQIQDVVKAQAKHKETLSSASFMDNLSAEQKAKIEAYKQSNPEQDNEKQGHKQSHKPELD